MNQAKANESFHMNAAAHSQNKISHAFMVMLAERPSHSDHVSLTLRGSAIHWFILRDQWASTYHGVPACASAYAGNHCSY